MSVAGSSLGRSRSEGFVADAGAFEPTSMAADQTESRTDASQAKERTREEVLAYLALLEENHGIILKVCRAYCRHKADREDLFQEIASRLWDAYPTFKGRSKASTWVYSVAMKTAAKGFRGNRPDVEARAELPHLRVEAEASVESDIEVLLYSLEPDDRGIVTLLMEGYTRLEVAEIMEKSEDAVRMRLHRLKGKFIEIENRI